MSHQPPLRHGQPVSDIKHDFRVRYGVTVCLRCGMVRNRDRQTPCRGALPRIAPRFDFEQFAVPARRKDEPSDV